MLQLLTIVLAIAFSLSNEPPQAALRDQDRPAFVELKDDGAQPPNPAPKKTDEYPAPPVPR